MLFGPVFTLELLTTARRPRYFVLRTAYGLILLGFLLYYAHIFTIFRSIQSFTIGEVAYFGDLLFGNVLVGPRLHGPFHDARADRWPDCRRATKENTSGTC